MLFFRRLALHRFVKMHAPSRQVSPADRELVSAYEGILPASLIELWRRKGLGFYGDLQLALIDPRPWQPVLDRWIVSPTDAVRRTPIALTPFGVLLYHRKLTATDEDVAYIDPVTKQTGDLAWSLDEFFNRFLCERETLGSLVPPSLAQAARKECGVLAPGEVYEIDQLLFSMQMLKITKTDAFELHRRLRDAVDPPEPKDVEPVTLADAVPAQHRVMFEKTVAGERLAGLYLSSYIDWHRLLALEPDGHYRLLFWRIHHKTFERTEIRLYAGTYQVSRNAEGDETVELDITLRADSLGSDANDERLVAMHSGGATWLLNTGRLGSIATAIGGRDTMGRSEDYFRRVTPDQAFEEEPSDGRDAPPFADLPHVLQAMIHVEPLRPRITHVADPNPDEEDDGDGTVMCTLDLGEDDGLRMNMPLYSLAETGRDLKGWVWKMDPCACQAGIKYRRGEDGTIEHGPVVGDVLTTRAP
ncbi:GAD-like domain-containing protein [Mesorhizobium amorphae]|uniref:GAD-like domain-containing protein n=1 Tax=Mesorhizobium amorphae TaxID=71433 RepID=UPI001185C4B2|nr:GAD-like domain-containing protein [Mesorhizobium amorphae]